MQIEQEELKRVNLELKEIINNSWDGIAILDRKSHFIYVNDAFIPMLGFTKDELLKKDLLSLLYAEYKASFNNLLIENIKNAYQTDLNVICQRKDSKPIYLKLSVSLMLNKQYFVLNAKDVTKEISDHKILDHYVLSLHLNNAFNITEVSHAFCNLSGFDKDKLLKNSASLIGLEDAKLNELKKSLSSQQEWNEEIKLKKANNSTFFVNIKAKPIFNKYGDIIGSTLLMFDLSNEKALNSQIEQKDQILIDQSKLAIMNDTIKIISHEWRQPLNLISLNAQKLELKLLSDEQISKDVFNAIQSIKEQTLKLSATIDEVRSLGNQQQELKACCAEDIITHALSLFHIRYENNGIKINKEVTASQPFETLGSELSNVLVNILVNAKEALQKENISDPSITICSYEKENSHYFEIKDNAKGVNEEIIDKIFDPYFSTKESKQGVGLSLYSCKLFVQMHLHGELTVHNDNQGAVFTIKLPIKGKE